MKNKTVVIGILNRDTKEVMAKKVESAKASDLKPTIYENIKEGSTIVTDEWRAYNSLKKNSPITLLIIQLKSWLRRIIELPIKSTPTPLRGSGRI